MTPRLTDLEHMARYAGQILHDSFGQVHQVDYKGVIDPVTEVDRRSEAYILGEIRSRFPDHRILSEESGFSSGKDGCQWFVDPLDGTVNFAHGLPIFSVSIAYAEDGEVRLGVVYDPMREECYQAERGTGAWLNGKPILVSETGALVESILVTGFPYDIQKNPQNNLDHFGDFMLRCQGVRRLGSAALDLCYVAAGRIDGYWEISIDAWDVAAGGLIAEQAGAKVTNIRGGRDYLSPPSTVLAANRHIYPQMMQVLLGKHAD
jgi:myo-inositol-1(or 4)-monophosphatase